MILTFDKKEVLSLIEWQNKNGHKKTAPYSKKKCEPSLVLVGDQGVYLMNWSSKKSNLDVAYAKECDPRNVDFDSWWGNKNKSFGPDDGADLIPIKWFDWLKEKIKDQDIIEIDVTPNDISMKTDLVEVFRDFNKSKSCSV